MCGDDFAFGDPSWLASLCSLKLARRPSTLPLPFLWANLTPRRPFPILTKGRAGTLEECLCGGGWGPYGSGGRGRSCARRRRCGECGGDGEACDHLLNRRPCLLGEGGRVCVLRRNCQGEAGVLVCPRRVTKLSSVSAVQKGRAGAMLKSEGWRCTAAGVLARMEWSFTWQQRWAALDLVAWRAGVCKLLRQLRQYVSVQASGPPVARPLAA